MSAISESSCLSWYTYDTFEVFMIIVLYRLIAGSPLSEMDEYRVEICLVLRKLERLDKDKFTEDERADAEEVCCTHEMLKFNFFQFL